MKKTLPLIALVCLPLALPARVSLPRFFSDNMIVQQNAVLHFRGTAAPGSTVTVCASWTASTASANADGQGLWQASLPTCQAGGPYTITVSDGEELTFRNVLVGEVWLCSGQSNMEMPLAAWGYVKDYEKEISEANYPQIRLLNVAHTRAFSPQDDVTIVDNAGWTECSPATVPPFSATAYFFARELWKSLHIPVGVINTSWGGTPAESWTSYEWLADVPGYEKQMADLKAVGYTDAGVRALYARDRAVWENQVETADKGRQALADTDDNPTFVVQPQPFEKFLDGFDGAVWFTFDVEIPAAWAGHDITLHLGQIDDEDITWWNDVKVGSTENWSAVRSYTVKGEYVKAGTNTVTLRANDTGGNGGLVSPAEQVYVVYGNERIPLGGEWRYAVGLDAGAIPPVPVSTASASYPACLYNAMIHPFRDFAFQGVIWYQGCANVGRAAQYEPLFQSLICNWRELFHRPDMPFYFVQIANYLQHFDLQPESDWAAIREAQTRALRLPNTGMACIIEKGEANDIHPKDKQTVGFRLGALALHHTYGKKVTCGAPAYEGYTIEGNVIRCRFSQPAGTEPFVANKAVTGFSIQDSEGLWHVAEAHTDGATVVVSHPEVKHPVACRYGWADNPSCNLHTKSGFPVAPFRTDWVPVLEK